MAESRQQSPRVHVLPVRVAAAFGVAPVLHFLGMVFTGLGVVMLIPALVEQDVDALGFVAAAAVTLFTGVTLALGFAGEKLRINLRQGVLAVILTWIGAGLFGSLPFQFAQQPLGFTDAIFETISGLSATGSTVYRRPRPGAARHPALALPADLAGRLRPGHLRGPDPALSAHRRPAAVHGRSVRPAGQVPAQDRRGRGARSPSSTSCSPLACAIAFGYAGMCDVRCHRARHGGDRHRRLLLARRRASATSRARRSSGSRPCSCCWRAMPFALHVQAAAGQCPPAAHGIAGAAVRAGRGRRASSCWRCGAWIPGPPRFEQALREASFNVVSIISTTGLHLARLPPLGRLPRRSCSCAPC